MPGSILAVVDQEGDVGPALQKTAILARQCGAELEVFMCAAERAYWLQHQYDAQGTALARQACMEESRKYLDQLCASLETAGITVSVDAVCETPLYAAVVHKIRRSRAALVIRVLADRAGASSGVPGKSQTDMSAADWELARTTALPLLFMRGRRWEAIPKMIAAVDVADTDGPSLGEAVLRTSRYIATLFGATLETIYVAPVASQPQLIEGYRSRLALSAASMDARPEQVHVLCGEPTETMAEFARRYHYDLWVLGALSHRPSATALVGTLSGRLMQILESDVLLVKPAGFRSPVC
jgi:universal stress protein E